MWPELDDLFEMKISETIGRFLRKVYPYVIIGIPIYVFALFFSMDSLETWPFIMTIATAIMLTGQFSAIYYYGFSYWLYFISCVISFGLSLFVWMTRHFPFWDAYFLALVVLVLILSVSHVKTRRWLRAYPMFNMFSIFLFGLLILLSPSEITPMSSDWMFALTLFLFIFVAVQTLNMTYRNRILNKELKISNIEDYIEKNKARLLKKFDDAKSDVDLLFYYFSSSSERFIEGDFSSSFMDAYKIVFDTEGKAFAKIYALPDVRRRMKPYSHTRAILAHAKGRGAKLPEIKQIQKELLDRTLDLLKIVKFEFIDSCKEQVK